MAKAGVKSSFEEVFRQLRALLSKYEARLVVVSDKPGNYYLNTRVVGENKKPVFFGAVRLGKTYVSYHLMPVYVFPDLLRGISAELKGHMQGKSCFNFIAVDRALFAQLSALTKRGYDRFNQAGMS